MTTCPFCRHSLQDTESLCPNCGAALTDTSLPTAVLPPPKQAVRVKGNDRSSLTSAAADPARLITGAMLTNRYRIVGSIGRGGMGEVYKAEDLKLDQTVALKFLPDALALDGAALARFHKEVRITRQVSHPNVCRVYDIGEVGGRQFLSMEFIDGEDLSSLLRRIGRLPGDKAVEIARHICAGLAAAHDNGVVHRDLKPANIMIDGRGRARITDFGVAVVAQELRGDEVTAGTPAYMAPEQLTGKEVTHRSDIYSLGLVLYELFTGKRVFDANNLPELIKLHEQTTPTTPSSHVKDIDPLVEKVILRCLEKDPNKRPGSAIQVAAALPGGDPLAAALAAGETPSPEMVAAAGEKTGLRPAIALSYLAAVIAGLIVITLLGHKVNWRAQVLQENSPDVLAHKARDIIQRLGYTNRPTDSASGLSYDVEYRRYVEQSDASLNRWSQLTKSQPAALFFWYRESPWYLEVMGWGNGGWITPDDPPRWVTGSVEAQLDPQGRLIWFVAVPPQIDQSTGALPAPDWTPLFAAAGLDRARFTPTEPNWTPLTGFDARSAWMGVYPDQPEIELRIEAATYRGKPVYFHLIGPWTRAWRMQAYRQTTGQKVQNVLALGVPLAILLGAVLLARYNFRLGRGDRRGAFRLAFFVFVAIMLSWVFGASHPPTSGEVLRFFLLAVSPALLLAGVLWLLYIALEPYVRQRWPNTIISWSRVLSGSINDPLVGRDVLVGVILGIGWTLLNELDNLVRLWRGAGPRSLGWIDAWLGVRYLIALGFLNNLIMAILVALASLFLIFLLRVLTRRQWLAAGIFIVIPIVMNVSGSSNPVITLVFSFLFFSLSAIALLRFGLLTMATGLFVSGLLQSAAITTDFSAWYATSALIVLVAVLALSAFAFHRSLGGQKLFEGKLLND
jgi:protein kinase-like protein